MPQRKSATSVEPDVLAAGSAYEKCDASIVLAVGGSGKRFAAELVRGLESVGSRLRQVIPGTRSYVDCIYVDGDVAGYQSQDDPDAALLRAAGVRFIPLLVRDQGGEFKRQGLTQIMTEGIRAEADSTGCNADTRVSAGRYHVLRQRLAPDENPVVTSEEIACDLLSLQGAVQLGNRVNLITAFGLHGGTGPVARFIAADALAVLQRILGSSSVTPREIVSIAYAMSSQSADLDRGMAANIVQRGKRRRNFATSVMYIDETTVLGGPLLPDGKTRIRQVPFHVLHLMHGQSREALVREHLAPMTLAARDALAAILGLGHTLARANVDLGIDEPEDRFKGPTGHWAAMGLSEVVSVPPREILLAKKKQALVEKATGIHSYEPTRDQALMNDWVQELGIDGLAETLLTPGRSIPRPSADTDEFGTPEQVAGNVDRVVTEYSLAQERYLAQLRVKVRERLLTLNRILVGRLDDLYNGKLAHYQVYLTKVLEVLIGIGTPWVGELKSLPQEVEARKEHMVSQASQLKAKPYNKWQLFQRGAQQRVIDDGVQNLIRALDEWRNVSARLVVMNELRNLIAQGDHEVGLPALFPFLRSESAQAEATIARILAYIDNIEPDGTFTTAFDTPVAIEMPDFSSIPVPELSSYDDADLDALLENIKLEPNEVDLVRFLASQEVVNRLRRASAPLGQTDEGVLEQKDRISTITLPIAEGETRFTIQPDGTVKGAGHVFPGLEDLTVRAVAAGGPIVVTQAAYRLNPAVEDDYTRKVISDLVNDALDPRKIAEVRRHFLLKGDLEKLLPPYAHDIALYKKAREAGQGKIVERPLPDNPGVKLSIYLTKEEAEAEAKEARKTRRAKPPEVQS